MCEVYISRALDSLFFFCASELYHEVSHFHLVYSNGKKIIDVSVIFRSKEHKETGKSMLLLSLVAFEFLDFCDSSFTMLKCI